MDVKKLLFRLRENWPAKMLSIAFALILFVFHRMSDTATRPLSVPLVVETNYALVPASAYPQNVRLQLRGESDRIMAITESDIEAFVDFRSHEVEGLYRAPVQIRKRGSALDVEPLEISFSPMEVSVQLNLRVSMTLPLLPDIRGRVSSGFDLISHSIFPAEVVVSGPANILEGIHEIRTEPIDLDGRTGDFSIEINILRMNPFIELRGSGVAEFQGIIRPSLQVTNIEQVPIVLRSLAPGFVVEADASAGSVRLGGSQYMLDTFRPMPGLLSVDFSSVSEPGIYVLPVFVNLPDGFVLIRHEPEELNVVVFEGEESLEEAEEIEEIVEEE